MSADHPPVSGGIAFLLAQLGAHAGDLFATALMEHDLTPPLAGLLRLVRSEPGLSQQDLAARLGLAPSRLVAHVDDLEQRGWLERVRDANDRRVNALRLTDAGREAFGALAVIARRHERAVTAGLDESQRATLSALLQHVAETQGLTPGVHPGFRRLR
ncbi:MarR family transcriptional regulator [Jatrophihabitans telluris]|uniref:MarR family transcriptional regulator n=1 Tax=Jatrophihabitans telluris TaxID=2038343 RepID=A0ABY4R376_9ACTN|nr:MarR family transcriptional regulator [Jatrophihabitans telluris]UQX90269.1 MarR family transcriptional regulator [Jatrophihabitans telluris]